MSDESYSDKEWLMVQRHAKLIALIKDNNKDLVKLVNAILDAITGKDMITRDMIEDWGQELEHITHRVKS